MPKRNRTADFARAIGRGSDVVARWSTGDRVPVAKDRARLEDMLDIPWRWWDDLLSNEEDDAEWLATEEAREVIARTFPYDAPSQAEANDAA